MTSIMQGLPNVAKRAPVSQTVAKLGVQNSGGGAPNTGQPGVQAAGVGLVNLGAQQQPAGAVSSTPINPNQSLVGQQFAGPGYAPVSAPDYSKAYGAIDNAMQYAGPASIGGFSYSADTGKVRDMTLGALDKALTGTDRGQIATDLYDQFVERSQPGFDQAVRKLGQNTAALGRVGSGIYGSNLTDLNTEREKELSLARRELSTDAAAQSLADRLNLVDASRGVGSDFSNQDLGAGELNQRASMFNAQQQNRAFDQGLDLAGVFGDFADRDYGAAIRERDTQYGVGRDQYGDAVGERAFQYGLSRDAVDDSYRKREFEEDMVDRALGRDIKTRTTDDLLYGNQFERDRQLYELGGSSTGLGNAYNNQANRYDSQAADAGASASDLFGTYGARSRAPAAPSSPSEDFYRRYGIMPDQIDIPTPSLRY